MYERLKGTFVALINASDGNVEDATVAQRLAANNDALERLEKTFGEISKSMVLHEEEVRRADLRIRQLERQIEDLQQRTEAALAARGVTEGRDGTVSEDSAAVQSSSLKEG